MMIPPTPPSSSSSPSPSSMYVIEVEDTLQDKTSNVDLEFVLFDYILHIALGRKDYFALLCSAQDKIC